MASGTWARYDQVNVQAGLDAWLAEPGRRAALRAAENGDVPLRVTDEHMNAALDELLDIRNQLTRILLGAPGRGRGPGGRRSPAALGADAVIPDRGSLSSGWPLRR